jgi:uncharacterized membrane protein YcfT
MPLFFAVAGLFAGKWLSKSWRDLGQGKLALLAWVFIIWQPVVFTYRLLNQWALEDLTWHSIAEQVLRLGASPLRPNGELWFLWTLVIFFLLGRLTAKFNPIAQVVTAAAISFVWMSLVEPNLSEGIFGAIGSGWHGLFRYYFLFIGFALFSKQIRAVVANLRWHTSALLFGLWLGVSLLAAHFEISQDASLFILSLLGVAGGLGLAKLLSGLAVLRYLGSQTLPIYLGHSAIIAIFMTEITAFELTPVLTLNLNLATLVLTFVVIALSLGISKLKPLTYMYQRPTFPSERAVSPSKQKSDA